MRGEGVKTTEKQNSLAPLTCRIGKKVVQHKEEFS
jgi:hypothetical protein